jgi:hypothetical protein
MERVGSGRGGSRIELDEGTLTLCGAQAFYTTL